MIRRRHSTKTRLAIFTAANGCCHICGGRIEAGQGWELEHVIALSMGGDDEASNMRPAHMKCHQSKTSDDLANLGKARRNEARHTGAKATASRPIQSRGFAKTAPHNTATRPLTKTAHRFERQS